MTDKEKIAESLAMLYGAGLLTREEYEAKTALLNGTEKAVDVPDAPSEEKEQQENMVLPILISVLLVLLVAGTAYFILRGIV